MKTKEEHKWIVQLMHDDEQALRSIYDAFSSRMFDVAFLILKDTGWSEDVVQEVFVKLWNSRAKLDPNGSLLSYLYVLTKRTSLNKLRDIKSFSSDFEQLWTNISRLSDCSHEQLIAKELSDRLDGVLDKLPERQREIFRLSRFEGLTHQQIAEALNVSPNTVKNHMVQALKTIRNSSLNMDYMLLLLLLNL